MKQPLVNGRKIRTAKVRVGRPCYGWPRHAVLFLLCSLFFQASVRSQDMAEKIDRLMKAYADCGVFTGAVLVAGHGSVIYKKAFGLADRELEVPLTAGSKFKIASLSKPFTALAVLQLVQEGRIRLNGTISDYIPDYSGPAGDSITIRQLLTHTSGIRGDLDPAEEFTQQRLHHEPRELVRYAETSGLLFSPGSKFGYSNFGYNILAYIVESISGKPFGQVLKERIFDPAGMRNTCLYDNSRVEQGLARGYEYLLLYGYRNPAYVDASITLGSGGIISTVDDLLLFNRALSSGKLLAESYMAGMFTPAVPGIYGYGWFIGPKELPGANGSVMVADHSGSIDGFGAYMARLINDSTFVVVLKNQRPDSWIQPAHAPEIGSQLISLLHEGEVPLPEKSVARHIAALIGTQGADSAIAEYLRIAAGRPGEFNMNEEELNKLGIELYFRYRRADDALAVFRLNMDRFPESYNTCDSYAYILMQKGDFENAIRYYKGLEVLKQHPANNNSASVKADSEKALIYIREMEERIKSKK